MSSDRRAYWNERHREGTAGAPEPTLVEMLPLMPRGLTLDIAAGLGRNAIALAEAGIEAEFHGMSAVVRQALPGLSDESMRRRGGVQEVAGNRPATYR